MTAIVGSLASFFEHIVPFLEGDTDARDLTRAIGPSPSGADRVAFYQTLVRRDTVWILESLFPATRAASDCHQLGLWDELVMGYSHAHYPMHWDPNPFGAQFPEYLEALASSGCQVPSYLFETADYEWISYAVGVAPDPPSPSPQDIGLDRTLFVRHYTHDIPRFAHGAAEGNATAPAEEPCSLLVFRDVRTLHSRLFYPSQAGLLVLAKRCGRAVRAPQMSDADFCAAEQGLIEIGALTRLG